jgi:hypothetical protein
VREPASDTAGHRGLPQNTAKYRKIPQENRGKTGSLIAIFFDQWGLRGDISPARNIAREDLK